MVLYGPQWCYMALYGVPWSSILLYGVSWDYMNLNNVMAVMVLLGLLRPSLVFHGLQWCSIELVSKELNHLAAILHVYAGGLNFMK